MQDRLVALARAFWPGLDEDNLAERMTAARIVLTLLLLAPLAVVGVIWLVLETDLEAARRLWWLLLAHATLTPLFIWLSFYLSTEVRPGMLITISTSLNELVNWSFALVIGPTALWVPLIWDVITQGYSLVRAPTTSGRASALPNLLYNVASTTFAVLVALGVYRNAGGRFPLTGFGAEALQPALVASLTLIIMQVLVAVPLLVVFLSRAFETETMRRSSYLMATVPPLAVAVLTEPFGILMAGVYTTGGPGPFFALLVMVLLGSGAVNAFSAAVERARRRSAEMEKLEGLAQEILKTPPDIYMLPDLLGQHMPGLFIYSEVALRDLQIGLTLYQSEGSPALPEEAWDSIEALDAPQVILPGDVLPWEEEPSKNGTLIVPVLLTGDQRPRAALVVSRQADARNCAELLPAALSLASQIASFYQAVAAYEQMIASQRTTQELLVAGEIQRSFLPQTLPRTESLKDWQISATIQSAHETSGDFFDLIPMWDGRLGVVIADVADKGLGAALYMAISRTLIRTYASDYSSRYPDSYAEYPDRVLNTVNKRIMEDTHNDLFVTVFYGILCPHTNTFTYANAGHNPPLLLRRLGRGNGPLALTRTGIPLGVLEDTRWDRRRTPVEPGDVIVLYTDGITEAENSDGQQFGEARLRAVIEANRTQPAGRLREAIIDGVRRFQGGAPQFDDITLIVIKRPAH